MSQSITSELIISRSHVGHNLSYVLSGEEAFSPVRYKMMQGMLESGLLPCVVYHYNGKPKLMYLTGDKKPLSSFGMLEEAKMIRLIERMAMAAQQLCAPGFLNLENVECGIHDIFADPESLDCFYVFLPLNNGGENSGDSFESDVIATMRAFLVDHIANSGRNIHTLLTELSRPNTGFEQILKLIRMMGGSAKAQPHSVPKGSMETGRHVCLVGMGTPIEVRMAVTKPEFVIGKSVNGVDGTLSFNPAISRVHCKIIQNGMTTYIVDLGSSNGTFVNGQRLPEGKPMTIQIGDKIRLANSDFELQGG